MIFRTSWEVNRNEWGARERALKLHASREGLLGKAKAKTGIGKSDLPGLQGGPRKRDLVSHDRCARLGSIPTSLSWRKPAGFLGVARAG
jgi:hypothetical protein